MVRNERDSVMRGWSLKWQTYLLAHTSQFPPDVSQRLNCLMQYLLQQIIQWFGG